MATMEITVAWLKNICHRDLREEKKMMKRKKKEGRKCVLNV